MRKYPEDQDDWDEVEKMVAPSWMIDVLKKNPDYCWWGPYEDYMSDDRSQWASPVFLENWDEFGWQLDDLNEVVNFYFEAIHESEECGSCQGTGYNQETLQISEDFYDFGNTGRKWNDKITQDEVDELIKHKRLYLHSQDDHYPTAEEVNGRQNEGLYSHDAINRWILIETRAKRLGVWGHCEECNGEGRLFTELECRLGLVLWVIHPRKGASRGVEIKRIKQEQLPEVIAYLKKAAERNANRFIQLDAG